MKKLLTALLLLSAVAIADQAYDDLEIAEKDFKTATPKLKQITYKIWQAKGAQLPDNWKTMSGLEQTNWCFSGWVKNTNELGVVTSRLYRVSDVQTADEITPEFITKETKELEKVIPKKDFSFKKKNKQAVSVEAVPITR